MEIDREIISSAILSLSLVQKEQFSVKSLIRISSHSFWNKLENKLTLSLSRAPVTYKILHFCGLTVEHSHDFFTFVIRTHDV